MSKKGPWDWWSFFGAHTIVDSSSCPPIHSTNTCIFGGFTFNRNNPNLLEGWHTFIDQWHLAWGMSQSQSTPWRQSATRVRLESSGLFQDRLLYFFIWWLCCRSSSFLDNCWSYHGHIGHPNWSWFEASLNPMVDHHFFSKKVLVIHPKKYGNEKKKTNPISRCF